MKVRSYLVLLWRFIIFTVFKRLNSVLSSKEGRRHFINTWRWSLGQAWRAASGIQISELLEELRLMSQEISKRDFHTKSTIDAEEFLEIARKHRAGKQSGHERVYSLLDLKKSEVGAILEIGIGTNDPKMPSSMGRNGVPGASLLVWRELFPRAVVIGADFDRKILRDSEKIFSFFVDSTNPQSIEDMVSSIFQTLEVSDFDLIIDDGLHTPEANLRNFRILHKSLLPGGFYVIEDVDAAWAPLFHLFCRSLDDFDFKFVPGDKQKNQYFLVLRKK